MPKKSKAARPMDKQQVLITQIDCLEERLRTRLESVDHRLHVVMNRTEKAPMAFEALQFLSRDIKSVVEMLREALARSNRDRWAADKQPDPAVQHGVAAQPTELKFTPAIVNAIGGRLTRLEQAASTLSDRISDTAANSRKHILSVQVDMEARIEHSLKEESKDWSRVERKADDLKDRTRNNHEAIQALFDRVAALQGRTEKLEAERDQLQQPKRKITKR